MVRRTGPPVQQVESAWARLRQDVDCGLRRGAWYRVVQFDRDEVILDMRRAPVAVPRHLVQVTLSRPALWSVVPPPRNATKLPSELGAPYAVCPVCGRRTAINDHPLEMRCTRCYGVFPLGWDERYLMIA